MALIHLGNLERLQLPCSIINSSNNTLVDRPCAYREDHSGPPPAVQNLHRPNIPMSNVLCPRVTLLAICKPHHHHLELALRNG